MVMCLISFHSSIQSRVVFEVFSAEAREGKARSSSVQTSHDKLYSREFWARMGFVVCLRKQGDGLIDTLQSPLKSHNLGDEFWERGVIPERLCRRGFLLGHGHHVNQTAD